MIQCNDIPSGSEVQKDQTYKIICRWLQDRWKHCIWESGIFGSVNPSIYLVHGLIDITYVKRYYVLAKAWINATNIHQVVGQGPQLGCLDLIDSKAIYLASMGVSVDPSLEADIGIQWCMLLFGSCAGKFSKIRMWEVYLITGRFTRWSMSPDRERLSCGEMCVRLCARSKTWGISRQNSSDRWRDENDQDSRQQLTLPGSHPVLVEVSDNLQFNEYTFPASTQASSLFYDSERGRFQGHRLNFCQRNQSSDARCQW